MVVAAKYGVMEDILTHEKSGSDAEEPSTGHAGTQTPEQGGQRWRRRRGAGESPGNAGLLEVNVQAWQHERASSISDPRCTRGEGWDVDTRMSHRVDEPQMP